MGLRWRGLSPKTLGDIWTNADRNTRREANQEFREQIEIIKEISKEQVPVDDGQLEEAHRVVQRQSNQHKLGLTVEVGGHVDDVNTDLYVLRIHEGEYNLGPNSKAKQAGTDRVVGRKFLERAFEERIDDLISAISKVLGRFG